MAKSGKKLAQIPKTSGLVIITYISFDIQGLQT